jgi:hypothetical protein
VLRFLFAGLIACVIVVGCSASGDEEPLASGAQQSRGNIQGFDAEVADESGEFAFRWIAGPAGQEPVEVQILEVIDTSTGDIVYRDAGTYRSRDVNVAAWASEPRALLAYSGDVGTVTIRPDGSGVWNVSDPQGCLSEEQIERSDNEVSSRLPAC